MQKGDYMGRLAGNWDGELAAPIADCWQHPINRRPITRGQLYGYIVIEEQSASKPARVISHKSIWMSCKVLNCFTFFRRWSCKLVHPEPHKSQRGCDNLHKICTNTLDSRVLGLYRIPDPIRGSAAAWTLPHSGVDWNFKRSIDNKVLGRDVFPFFLFWWTPSHLLFHTLLTISADSFRSLICTFSYCSFVWDFRLGSSSSFSVSLKLLELENK